VAVLEIRILYPFLLSLTFHPSSPYQFFWHPMIIKMDMKAIPTIHVIWCVLETSYRLVYMQAYLGGKQSLMTNGQQISRCIITLANTPLTSSLLLLLVLLVEVFLLMLSVANGAVVIDFTLSSTYNVLNSISFSSENDLRASWVESVWNKFKLLDCVFIKKVINLKIELAFIL